MARSTDESEQEASVDAPAGLKGRLRDQGLVVGTFVKTSAAETIELLDLAGLDVCVVDAEHAPLGPAEVALLAGATQGRRIDCLVRVASTAGIGPALDAGAVGVVVPQVSSADEAAEAVRLAHYGPDGRGYSGSTRSNGYGIGAMADHLVAARRRTVVIVQVEDAVAVQHVEEIVAVKGVDGVLLGLADLTISLGADTQAAPEVVAAADRVRGAVLAAGLTLAEVVPLDRLADVRGRGVGLAIVGSDQQFVRAGATAVVAAAQSAT